MDQTHEQITDLCAVQGAVKESVFPVGSGAFQAPFYDVMPIAGLCRVGALATRHREGSLIFRGRFVGIITGSPRRRARGLAAGTGPVRDRMKSHERVRVPLTAYPRADRFGSFLSIRGRAIERSR